MSTRDSDSAEGAPRTVADLLAQYGGGSVPTGGRRRRRATDPEETAPQAIIDRVLSDSGVMRRVDEHGLPVDRAAHSPSRPVSRGTGTPPPPAVPPRKVAGLSRPQPPRMAPPPVAQPPMAPPPLAPQQIPPSPVGPSQVAPSPVAKPPLGQPPVAKPPVNQPPVNQPPVGQPPIGQPSRESYLREDRRHDDSRRRQDDSRRHDEGRRLGGERRREEERRRDDEPTDKIPRIDQAVLGSPVKPAPKPVQPPAQPPAGQPPATENGLYSKLAASARLAEAKQLRDDPRLRTRAQDPPTVVAEPKGGKAVAHPIDELDEAYDEGYDDELDDELDYEDEDEYDDEDEEESPAKEWLVMTSQLAIGAVGGAGLWLGFQWLWRFMPVAALVVALVVITSLVWVVRRIRRSDDLQNTVVTVLVGLFVTVSPAALLLLDR